MSEDRPIMVELSHDTRQKLRELADEFENRTEEPYDAQINAILTELLEERQAEEEAAEAKQDKLRAAILGEDAATSDEDAVSGKAADARQRVRERLGLE